MSVKKRRRWLYWLLLVLLLPVLLVGVRGVREVLAQSRLSELIAEADADDPNWRLEKLQEEYDRKPVDERLLAAIRSFPRNPVYRGWHGDDILDRPGALPYDSDSHPNARMPDQYLTLLRERLQDPKVEATRKAIRALGAVGRVPSKDESTTLNLIQELRTLANYECDEIALAIHDNRIDDAIDSIRRLFRIAESLEDCPSLIAQLVRIALSSLATSRVQTLLAHTNPNPEQLIRLQAVVMPYDRFDQLRLARLMRAQNHFDMERMHRDATIRDRFLDSVFPSPSPTVTGVDRVWAETRHFFGYQFFLQPVKDAHAEMLEILNDTVVNARMANDVQPIEPDLSRKGNVTRWMLASLFKISGAQAISAAQLRSAYTAIACERYRRATGKWPESLQELVPTYLLRVPLDPYTSKPLLLKTLPDGLAVYSVAKNRIDDGGKVLYTPSVPPDRGMQLFNPDKRGLKYQEVYPKPNE